MSGVSWWLLCSGWASDCFWGRLNWSEICRWLCLIVVNPVDYQAFFFVCLAAAQKRRWMEAFVQGRFHDTIYQVLFFNVWIWLGVFKRGGNKIKICRHSSLKINRHRLILIYIWIIIIIIQFYRYVGNL